MDLQTILSHPLLLNPYIRSFAILLGFYIISKIAHIILVKYITILTRKTKTDIDDKIIEKTNRPISLLLLVIGFYLAFVPFKATYARFADVGENIFASIIILIVTFIIMRIVDVLIDGWGRKFAERTESTLDDEVIPLFHRFSRIGIMLIGTMFILPVWGIEIGPLLASLGIAGIAVAFALQTTLGNIFGGASLIIDKAVKVGDVIEIEGGVTGVVTDVGLRSTRLRTYDNEMVVMPNGKLADSRITNFLQPDPKVRGIVNFGVAYGSDIDKVRRITIKTIKNLDLVLDDPEPRVEMVSLGDFSLNFRAQFWVDHFDKRFPTKCKILEELYNVFSKEGIDIPFPTRTIYMADSKEKK